jgi:hypothetical protein
VADSKGLDPTIKHAVIDAASGDNAIVAAVAGTRFRVLGYALVVTAATDVRFEDGAGGTALTGQMPLAANGGLVCPPTHLGYFETATDNTALSLECTQDVDGHITYQEFVVHTT